MAALVNYSGSSSEEDSDDFTASKNRKRSADDRCLVEEPLTKRMYRTDSDTITSSTKMDDESTKKIKTILPLPGVIQSLFGRGAQEERLQDDPTQHSGRVRTFGHVEGNWASYVYIPVLPDERLKVFIDQLLVCLRPLNFERMDDLHLSLSRTVCIRHHWIQPLTESLKEKFQQLEGCLCDITSIKMYTNDEKTRTFLSLKVDVEGTSLPDYVTAVNHCFTEFKLPHFYKDPSFHISLVWYVGDVISQITDKTRRQIEKLTSEFLSNNTDLSVLPVNQVCLKTGNKLFAFHLTNQDV